MRSKSLRNYEYEGLVVGAKVDYSQAYPGNYSLQGMTLLEIRAHQNFEGTHRYWYAVCERQDGRAIYLRLDDLILSNKGNRRDVVYTELRFNVYRSGG